MACRARTVKFIYCIVYFPVRWSYGVIEIRVVKETSGSSSEGRGPALEAGGDPCHRGHLFKVIIMIASPDERFQSQIEASGPRELIVELSCKIIRERAKSGKVRQ